jgi:hypothetical protein
MTVAAKTHNGDNMKKFASSFLALICSGVIATSAAQAAQTSHFRLSTNALIATFLTPIDGCQIITGTLTYGNAIIQTKGAPMTLPSLFVELEYQDSCNDIDLFFSGFAESVQSVSIRGDLGTATLVAQIPITDGTTTIPLSINLTFTATGDATPTRDTFHSHDTGTVFNSRLSLSSRSAVATGTVSGSFPTITGPQTLNAAAPGSFSASINSVVDGEITIPKR